MQNLYRRGFGLGTAPRKSAAKADSLENWSRGLPTKLEGVCNDAISAHSHDIQQTEKLVLSILEGESPEALLAAEPYVNRLARMFDPMGAAYNEGDDQEIEMVMFDAISQHSDTATCETVEDLWMKVSWLSFHDEDASLRFRFSFGVDLEEDVAADPIRQTAAAELAEAVFPESAIITTNRRLLDHVKTVLNGDTPRFVERILYFNAPNGGAYLHHDLERGHAGVVYAQVSGATLWLALPQQQLVDEVANFIQTHALPSSLSDTAQQELRSLAKDTEHLSQQLNSFSNDSLIHLINETQEFVQFLISQGHYRVLTAGDVILLPQKDAERCCWHSVFCLGEEMGQALSFAIR